MTQTAELVPRTQHVALALAALNALERVRLDLDRVIDDRALAERTVSALLSLDDAVRRALTREQTLARTSSRRRRALRQLSKALGRERELRKSIEDRLTMQKSMSSQLSDIVHHQRHLLSTLGRGSIARFLTWRASYRAVHV
jgi:hypothetical protein